MPGKRNTLRHRKLHGKINAAFFFSIHGPEILLETPLRKRMLFCIILCISLCGFFVFVLLISFFSEPETNTVESSLFMLFYWETKMPGKNRHCSSSFKKYSV